jgi:conjugal transfer pilus assembly protein TraW
MFLEMFLTKRLKKVLGKSFKKTSGHIRKIAKLYSVRALKPMLNVLVIFGLLLFLFFLLFFFPLFFSLFFPSSKVYAKDLGIYGEVFEIKEKHLLHWIKNRLEILDKKGELEKRQEFMQGQTRKHLFRPKAVEGVSFFSSVPLCFARSQDHERKSWLLDPSYILKKDIIDQNGMVLHRAGKEINPLRFFSLPCNLLFIDGDNKNQIEWALKESIKDIDKSPGGKSAKIILVKGEILGLMKEHKRTLYFDQQGILTRYFGINVVPVKVSQEGMKLKVEEVCLIKAKEITKESPEERGQII